MKATVGAIAAGAFLVSACATAEEVVSATVSEPEPLALECPHVAAVQGGLAMCRTAPGADVLLNGNVVVTAGPEGWAVVGFSRNAGRHATLSAHGADGQVSEPVPLGIAAQDYNIERIDGLPPSTVTPRTPEQQAEVERSWIAKRAAFENIVEGAHYLAGFIQPVEGRISGVYGSQRILNGEPRNPHLGLDMAADEGTPILAPAGGVVTLADDNLYFEGGTIFLDHGQGLVSVMMHMSRLDVAAGDVVAQGDVLGGVGATGRATGPHLHWGLKWRDNYYVDPALALELMAPSADSADSAVSSGVSDR